MDPRNQNDAMLTSHFIQSFLPEDECSSQTRRHVAFNTLSEQGAAQLMAFNVRERHVFLKIGMRCPIQRLAALLRDSPYR